MFDGAEYAELAAKDALGKRKEIYAAIRYVATFHCDVEDLVDKIIRGLQRWPTLDPSTSPSKTDAPKSSSTIPLFHNAAVRHGRTMCCGGGSDATLDLV